MSSELVEMKDTNVPVVAEPADDLTAADISFPMLLIQQPLSVQVSEGITTAGDVIVALSTDDEDPEVLIHKGEGNFTGYPIARRKFVARQLDNGMEYLPDNYVRGEDESDVWTGFQYLLYIPEYHELLPVRAQLWKTAGRPASKNINFCMEAAAVEGGNTVPNIKFGCKLKTSKGGHKYWQLTATPAEADDHAPTAVDLRSKWQPAFIRTANQNDSVPAETVDQPDIV